ncbi:MAG TPA: T9SS type A sorting domain-containing protein, partial [Bacteroidota bacterium]|nr:T9SS type A sorting domain-containing protein [Bacteroidota bacterium]
DKVAGDSIFTRQVFYSPDSLSVPSKGTVGQIYKFGIKGSDNEGGQGGYGNNHSQNIVDNDSVYTIFTQFGAINPAFYSAWNYDLDKPNVTTGVKDPKNLPRVFALAQNYPNPFNPVTRIEYQVPKTAVVTIKVYNVLGQEVSTLVNSVKTAGYYQASFGGAQYSTGIYFYRMSAGSFVSTKKMVYLK